MNKFHFVILFLLAFSCLLIQGKKEEKTAVTKTNTNILEYVQLFKNLLSQTLSKADFSSVRGMLSSVSPLSIGATAISVLLGGIVLMSFYESPLSPLPVPPLPQPPVGRFPPENPIVPSMNNRLQRLSSSSAMHLTNPEQYLLREQRRRMLYSPVLQNQAFIYPKNSQYNNYPTTNIKRSSNNDVFSYTNQMLKNNLKTNNMNANKYHLFETPLYNDQQPDLSSPPSSVQSNNLRKDTLKNNNLQTSESSGHLSFATPLSPNEDTSKLNSNSKNNNLNINASNNNLLNNQLNIQTHPVYRPVDDEGRSNEKVNLDHYAIKEQDFDQKQLVHSQLSQIEFKTSPELAKLEENLKRSSE